MAAGNKFNSTVANLANGVFNLGADTIKVMLTNTTPVAANAARQRRTPKAGALSIAPPECHIFLIHQVSIHNSPRCWWLPVTSGESHSNAFWLRFRRAGSLRS